MLLKSNQAISTFLDLQGFLSDFSGYAEAFRPVQSDSQTSEWYSYFENDVLELENTHKKILSG